MFKHATAVALIMALVALVPASSRANDGDPDWQRVNQVRVASGLMPVTENPDSRGSCSRVDRGFPDLPADLRGRCGGVLATAAAFAGLRADSHGVFHGLDQAQPAP